ncbi:C-terminal helicase domain-containing protein, partial [Streptomyces sp. NPDC057445]|uniref:C-terminal helicase domain-containing protein n=1 Tax=Streptomyces sp. NPDC057445 TaxID=3346136 RepID=UPI003683ACC8
CELGYASTIHRAQGMTVDTSHALASPRSDREGVYVQLTRGKRTNRLYVAIEDGDRLDDVLAAIAARRRTQLSATESITALHQELSAPGQLAAEFADVAERATTARLTGVLEHTLGLEGAAAFLAADAYRALMRAMSDAERAGFDLPRLLEDTAARGFGGADDRAAVLTWRLRERLADAAAAHKAQPTRPLAALSLTQLQTLARLAATHRAAARAALQAADAALTHLPTPVTTQAGHTHPAWPDRPLGPLSRTELAAQLAAVRAQIRRTQTTRIPLTQTARNTLAGLIHESRLRRALTWRERAREDYQRQQTNQRRPHDAPTSLAATRRAVTGRRTTATGRQEYARAALARADAVTGKIAAELRYRDRLPDHPPHRQNHHGDIPDWVADRHALTHPDTPLHWREHLAERHRILARSLAERGHTLAAEAPAWARPLGPPPPATSPLRRAAWARTCALLQLWRTRHAISNVPGLGPRPEDPDDAAAWDDLDARIRALTGRRRPHVLPPPDAPASVVLAAALSHLQTPPPSGALPDHPALRDPHGITPTTYAAADARTARRALAAVLAGEPLPETWMEDITAPGQDDEDEQRTWLRVITAVSDYRRRHHRAGPDLLGPRPPGLDGQEWDHLTDAIDLYTHARITHRLEQIRERTTATRQALLPPTSPLHPQPAPDSHEPGNRPTR